MAEGGFISLHRKVMEWPVWKSFRGEQRMVVVHLLLLANWKSDWMWDGTERVEIKRGELAHSNATIAEEAGVTIKVVRTVLEHLEKDGFLAHRMARRFRVISILKYDLYQSSPASPGLPSGLPLARGGPAPGPGVAPREQGEQGEQVIPLHARRPKKPPPAPTTEAGIWLLKTWPDIGDADGFLAVQREAHPGIDVFAEAKRAKAWEVANPERAKKNHKAFLNGWFGRQQDRAPRAGGPAPPVAAVSRVGVQPIGDEAWFAEHGGKDVKLS